MQKSSAKVREMTVLFDMAAATSHEENLNYLWLPSAFLEDEWANSVKKWKEAFEFEGATRSGSCSEDLNVRACTLSGPGTPGSSFAGV